MGYYTQHNLTVRQSECDLISDDEHKEMIANIAGYGEDLFDGGTCKWYEHKREMREYSKKFSKTFFTLRGIGEESGDFWVEYYLGGKMQLCKARIVYDDFDINKMG